MFGRVTTVLFGIPADTLAHLRGTLAQFCWGCTSLLMEARFADSGAERRTWTALSLPPFVSWDTGRDFQRLEDTVKTSFLIKVKNP